MGLGRRAELRRRHYDLFRLTVGPTGLMVGEDDVHVRPRDMLGLRLLSGRGEDNEHLTEGEAFTVPLSTETPDEEVVMNPQSQYDK